MGLGGLVTGIMGATGNSPKSSTPNSGAVGNDYMGLIQNYLNSQPSIYENEAQYSPKYTDLALANQSRVRQANINDVASMGPNLKKSISDYNPTAANLIGRLGQQANDQLSYNGALDPATQRMVQQSTRSSQAARGVGYGPGDAAQEQFYQTQTMEQRRAANQAFAGQVAGEEENLYGNPYTTFNGMAPVSATPQLISPQQSDSMLGTAFNANAAVNIGNANAQTAMEQGFNSFS